jgi:nicotinamide mononucleotide transporter
MQVSDWMDWIGLATGVLCVYLTVREKDINWPIGLLNSGALLAVFFSRKLYAQSGVQVCYVAECAFGWWMWTRTDRQTGRKLIRIGHFNTPTLVLLTAIGIPGVIVLQRTFQITHDPAPLWDAIIAVTSLIAETLLCLKIYESWAIYLGSDLIALGVFASLGTWVTFATYLCFSFLCIRGIFAWQRSLQNQTAAENLLLPGASVA